MLGIKKFEASGLSQGPEALQETSGTVKKSDQSSPISAARWVTSILGQISTPQFGIKLLYLDLKKTYNPLPRGQYHQHFKT